ncbi:mucin-2-like [Coffea eugenioides]|uniref:mucin-2-like n=1 Tax=Coffea eugenioides TaxID=49369 RepID=UPI000F60A975|nr:mucin-2-like [Coffea eugenioides]
MPQTAATTEAPPQPSVTITPPPTTPQTAATTEAPPQPSISTAAPPAMPQTAETQIPSQPSTTTTPAPTTQTAERATVTQPTITTRPTQTPTPQAPERPPYRPPAVAPAQGPPPQSQTSRTESQPSSPSPAITQPRVPSQPASLSRVDTPSQAPSQPSTPPHAAPQQEAVSLPSSPSRRSTQLPSTPQTATQPRSPSLAPIQAGQTSPPPPSSTTAQRQPTTAAATQLTSPLKTEQSPTKKNSQSSASSTEGFSPSDKQEPKSAVSESLPLEFQPKTAVPADNIHDSQDRAPIKTSVQPNEMTQQPLKESGKIAAEVFTTTEGPETPVVTQKSTSSTINGKPESFSEDMKPEEPKEVKEVMQDIKDKAHDRARHIGSDLKVEQGQTVQTKDLSTIPFQSEQAQKTIARKEMTATSASNGKENKIPTTHPRNKTMLADSQQKQRNSSGDHTSLHKEIRDDISKLVNKMAIGDSKHSIDDRPVSVITLAGENRGASMHVGFDTSKKEGSIHIRRGYKIKPDDSTEATTDGEESFNGQSDNSNAKEDQASEAYVNSNAQGINNSILFNASITEGNPGVHLIHSHCPTELKKPSQKPELIETRKAEFNMTPSQKLTHEPTVRRRCLRGLFLESSDSDLDAAKPRRHGCRVGCKEKSKENNIDVL